VQWVNIELIIFYTKNGDITEHNVP